MPLSGASFSNWHKASLWASGHVLLVAPCSSFGGGNLLSSGLLCYGRGSERAHDLPQVSLQPVAALT